MGNIVLVPTSSTLSKLITYITFSCTKSIIETVEKCSKRCGKYLKLTIKTQERRH